MTGRRPSACHSVPYERSVLTVPASEATGPLHHAHKWPEWTGPDEFATAGQDWQDGYNFVPCGCLPPPRLSYRTMT